MEAYAIISIQTASPALDFQCLVFLTDELKTQLPNFKYFPFSKPTLAMKLSFTSPTTVVANGKSCLLLQLIAISFYRQYNRTQYHCHVAKQNYIDEKINIR